MKTKRFFTKGARNYGATHLELEIEAVNEIVDRLETLDETEKRNAVLIMKELNHPQFEEVVANLYELI